MPWLVRAVEGEIVPRLLMHALQSRSTHGEPDSPWRPTADDLSEFASILTARDGSTATAYISLWLHHTARTTLYLELLAPAALYLRALRADRRVGLAQLLRARYRLLRIVHRLRANGSEFASP